MQCLHKILGSSIESMKKTKKTMSYHHGNLKNACIKQGVKFLNKGEGHFTLRQLAKEIGVSHGAPSRHFPTKSHLLAAIAEEGFRKLNLTLKSASGQQETKINSLSLMCEAYVQFGIVHQQHYKLMFGHLIPQHTDFPSLFLESKHAIHQLIMIIEDNKKIGLLKNLSTSNIALSIWSKLHGLTMLIIDGQFQILELEENKKLNKEQRINSIIRDQIDLLVESFSYI